MIEHSVQAEVLFIKDKRMVAYLEEGDTFTERIIELEPMIKKANGYAIDYIDWAVGSPYLTVTVAPEDKDNVLKIIEKELVRLGVPNE
jgi:hypothetical protein